MELNFLQVKETSGDPIHSPNTVAGLMTEEARADRECFWVLHLNSRNKIIEKKEKHRDTSRIISSPLSLACRLFWEK